jgi:signal transduction histidine kinase
MEHHEGNLLRRRGLKWLLVFWVWTLLGLFDATQFYVHSNYRNKHITWDVALASGLADWYIWALLSPLMIWLARRFPFEQRCWLPRLVLHSAACVVIIIVKVALDVPAVRLIHEESALPSSGAKIFEYFLSGKFFTYALIYWVVLGSVHALDSYRRYQERVLRASQLEARLAQAQLQVLKMQLHPHFLFNTLHAISALMHKDVQLADRMLARLAELLRSALENAGTQEVPLHQELEFIQPYLEIEQARLGPRLSVQMDIDPATLTARVPNLLLQPLVENAIRHGVAAHTRPGRIEIRSRRRRQVLQLQVQDDGPGLPVDQRPAARKGLGVANTRARLQQLYGGAHDFAMSNGPQGGLVVTVSIPFREDAE